MTEKSTVVVMYRMDGCGHCDALLPTWQKLETEIQKPDLAVIDIEIKDTEASIKSKLTTVNSVVAAKVLEEKAKVHGFPTMMKITESGATEFAGKDREEATLKKWILGETTGGRGKRRRTATRRKRKTTRKRKTNRHRR
jgi:thiol-disulfide isomerase/thioredoxin